MYQSVHLVCYTAHVNFDIGASGKRPITIGELGQLYASCSLLVGRWWSKMDHHMVFLKMSW